MSDSYQDMENSVIVEATSPEVPKSVKKRNKKLCKRFPFLIPTNEWSGKRITDCCGPDGEEGYWPGSPDHHPDYDWEYTKLDDMPEGWRKAFGEQMCEEIMQELVEHDLVDSYRVTQIKEKYGCYDPETEVLTKAGWKYFADITMDDEFATLDSDGETLVYQRPSEIMCYDYSGRMYHLENRGVNLLVTDNHRLYVAKGSYYNHAKNNEKHLYDFEFATPDKYYGKDKRFKKGARWIGNNPYGESFHLPGYYRHDVIAAHQYERTYRYEGFNVPLIPWLRFLGFYIAEGHTDYRNGAQISVAYNPDDEEELVSRLIRDIGFDPKQSSRCCKRFHNTVVGRWLLYNCGGNQPERRVPEFIKDLPPDLIKEFLTYLYIGDGRLSHTSNILTTTSQQLCDDVCELLVKAGYSFRYTIRDRRGTRSICNGRPLVSKHICYEINWLNLTDVEIDNSKCAKSFIERWEQYHGPVYCVTIPSHILYVRRGGKGVWCGNSLRWYDNFGTDKMYNEIFPKYEELSRRTCINCGAPATRISTGWISPWCDQCILPLRCTTVPIEEWFKEEAEDEH